MEPENHWVVEENRPPRVHFFRLHVGLFPGVCLHRFLTTPTFHPPLGPSSLSAFGRVAWRSRGNAATSGAHLTAATADDLWIYLSDYILLLVFLVPNRDGLHGDGLHLVASGSNFFTWWHIDKTSYLFFSLALACSRDGALAVPFGETKK